MSAAGMSNPNNDMNSKMTVSFKEPIPMADPPKMPQNEGFFGGPNGYEVQGQLVVEEITNKDQLLILDQQEMNRSEPFYINVLLVYDTKCGHCQRFKPEYIDVAKKRMKMDDKSKQMYRFYALSSNVGFADSFFEKRNIDTVPRVFSYSPLGVREWRPNVRNAQALWDWVMQIQMEHQEQQ